MLSLSVIILFKSLLYVFYSLVFSAHNSSGTTKLLLFKLVLVLRIIMVDLHMTVAPDQNAITIYCFHALDNEHQYDEPMSSLYI